MIKLDKINNKTYNKEFARYYDKITTHKDYSSEIESLKQFIENKIKDEGGQFYYILDVGCGTGSHSIKLVEGSNYKITGIDLSEEMIAIAKTKTDQIEFYSGDIRNFKFDYKFDFAYSLFNVINCLSSMNHVLDFFTQIYKMIRNRGFFFFEAWNAIPVINDPPVSIERVYIHGNERIKRIVEPELSTLPIHKFVLDYQIIAEDISSGSINEFNVKHHLTLYTPLEIEHCLKKAGFREIEFYSNLPDLAPLSGNDRMLSIICKK